MTDAAPRLPIDDVLEAIGTAIADHGRLVLQAPPGAGKTTRVPLYLDRQGLISGRILMLEPRRVAARTAAERMASQLGEGVGLSVGYRMRGESRASKNTRIEVVTEGVLTRMIQSDPELSGIGCIIFDEFHERALQADLGLALVLEIRAALRPDLAIIIMSATLDAGPVAALLDDAPVVTSKGRMFPVKTIWRDRPIGKERLEHVVADAVVAALDATEGGILVFLPGQAEIGRAEAALKVRVGGAEIRPLYGALPFKAQMAALAPSSTRKIVLATAIAETSLTIPDVRVVIDAGRARRPRFDPGSGMSRLVTERVTKAEAEQRRGRAGRVAPGWCYRLWTKGEEGSLAAFPPVEIEAGDLTGLALELAIWGAEPTAMPFLTPPPAGTYGAAVDLLRSFGALDGGSITDHGRALAALPLHPRLGQMVLAGREIGAATTAARLAAILNGRDPVGRGEIDMARRISAVTGRDQGGRLAEIRSEIKRLAPEADSQRWSPGAVLSLAYPDRIGRKRPGGQARYILSGGKGAVVDESDPLAGSEWLVIPDLDGNQREARAYLAAPAAAAELRELHASAIEEQVVCDWNAREKRVRSERQTRLGAVILDRVPVSTPEPEAARRAMLDGIRSLGLRVLPWKGAAAQLRDRARWAGRDVPSLDDETLLGTLGDWLGPYLDGMLRVEDLARVDLMAALEGWIGWDGKSALDRLAPTKFTAPTGSRIAIDYGGDVPKISVRLQEMLGVTTHPTIGAERIPALIELLSPARRPIQITRDLPGFWSTSYADVRKDMRGRYPRHHWPEDPADAEATRRVKPRPK